MCRQEPDRVIEQTCLRISDDHRAELRQGSVDNRARLDNAALDTLAHVDDSAIDPGDEAVDALQEIVVIGDGFERMNTAAGTHQWEFDHQAAQLAHRQQMGREAAGFQAQSK